MRTPDDYEYERKGFSLLNKIGIELEKQREAEARNKPKYIPNPTIVSKSSNKPFQLNLNLDL